MRFRRKFTAAGISVVLLCVLGIPQLQAQSSLTLEGLSSQISTLRGRIASLSNNKADRSELQALALKVATLEAKAYSSGPTATRRPATPTSTRSRPTATPTPDWPMVTTIRPVNIRSGPGTSYQIVSVATVGAEFFIIGKNEEEDWLWIVSRGVDGWVYAPSVKSDNTDRISVVPTPTLSPTATPRHTSTPVSSSERGEAEFAMSIILSDQRSMGSEREWLANSQSFKDEAVALAAELLINVADYCDLSVAYTAALVDSYGDFLDQRGFAERNPLFPVRQLMLFSVQGVIDEYPRRPMSCDAMFDAVATRLLEEE